MSSSILPDPYVLDALANDIEDLEGILRMLNSDTPLGWYRERGCRFQREEVVEALCRTIRGREVRGYLLHESGTELVPLAEGELPSLSFDEAWFEMTDRGRLRHADWRPPTIDML